MINIKVVFSAWWGVCFLSLFFAHSAFADTFTVKTAADSEEIGHAISFYSFLFM
jgi:hypothetical protein